MTRIGINPARGMTSDYQPASVTVAMLTYIPSLDGYFENRLEVLKLAFASLIAHTSVPFDLYVFDNGSCEIVVEYLRSLQNSGLVETLLLSRQNIGKIDALKILFNAAPGKVIAYSDDDIFFYPGWLEDHLEILDGFPKAGMVSGLPVRSASGHAMESIERLSGLADEQIQLSRERFIPDDWEIDWALSTGRDPDAHLIETQNQQDLMIRNVSGENYKILEAVGGANHFQFVSPKSILLKALPVEWTQKLMGAMIELDEAVDRLGYLRLSTAKRVCRHMGNYLSDGIRKEAADLGLKVNLESNLNNLKLRSPGHRAHWIRRIPGSRRFLVTIYKRLFDILYK